MINSKQRAHLRSLAHNLDPALHIGKDVITKHLVKQANDYLEANELMKVTVMKTVEQDIKEIANDLAKKTSSEVVQVIGKKFTLYRQNKKTPKIKLP